MFPFSSTFPCHYNSHVCVYPTSNKLTLYTSLSPLLRTPSWYTCCRHYSSLCAFELYADKPIEVSGLYKHGVEVYYRVGLAETRIWMVFKGTDKHLALTTDWLGLTTEGVVDQASISPGISSHSIHTPESWGTCMALQLLLICDTWPNMTLGGEEGKWVFSNPSTKA